MINTPKNRISQLRKQQNMTQVQLAEKSGLPCHRIQQYERQTASPSAEDICTLTTALNTSADYLLGLTNRPTIYVDDLPTDIISALEDLINTFCRKDKQARD